VDVLNSISDLFATRGHLEYFGEAVSEEEHALQAAHLADRDGADETLVAAALLHDIGHLLHSFGEDAAERGIDARHEDIGHAWLARWFGPAVAEPVRLHVEAKRYLCATDPAYLDRLSPASRQSLELQGGLFTQSEVMEFERHPHHAAAVRLRRWDDAAKVPDWAVPALAHYMSRLRALLNRNADHESPIR
jgi:phosphonate degradation associated HDIG domain protein